MKVLAAIPRGLLLLLLPLLVGAVPGQDKGGAPEEELERIRGMSLADLLETEIRVTSHKAQTARESSGIVSVVTADEIRRSGARDLLDVLRLVQGFEFGVDVHSVIGLGFRGNWGLEGKILVLLDGLEMNETLYGVVPFGNHFPVDQIHRLEIIRGPGSVMYGGNAELAVVNIVTKGAAGFDGVYVHGMYGTFGDTWGRRDAGLVAGYRKGELRLDAAAFFGQGRLSGRDYTDIEGDVIDLGSTTAKCPGMVNIGVSYRGLAFRFVMDRYLTEARDGWGLNYPEPIPNDFPSYLLEARYEWRPTARLKLTPSVQLKSQAAFNGTNEAAVVNNLYFDLWTDRRLGRLTLEYEASKDLSILAGAEYRHDFARTFGPDELASLFTGDLRTVDYSNGACFAQGTLHTALADFTGGIRFEHHSQFGSSVVPRFAATRTGERWHVKVLFAKAFRAPTVANIDYNPDIRPEKAYSVEIELGWRPARDVYLTGNVFYQTLRDNIVYVNEAETLESTYLNLGRTTTWGVEADLRWKRERLDLHLGYSWYRVSENDAPPYEVPGDEKALLAFPNHKFTASGTFLLGRGFSLNTTFAVLGKRHGYRSDGAGTLVPDTFPARALWNVYLLRENCFAEGLDLGVGLYNLLGSDYAFIQPYQASHTPLPGPSRELVFKLGWRFDWKH